MHAKTTLFITIALFIIACNSARKDAGSDSMAIRRSPVLSPEESLLQFRLEKGFDIQLVAAEPQVFVPIAMTFDEHGRLWVAEMTGYMPDTSGIGEDIPNGKIVILEDTTGDGRIDKRTVFIDSLVLPRALCIVGDELLVAEPPYLRAYNLSTKASTVVDAAYSEGGNVEHQPNGLLRALDNWIYSAKSNKRYRRKNGRWLKEDTHFRGQWGITQDDRGRLFYNNNSENVLGDYFSPGVGAGRDVRGFNEQIVADNRVFPIRPTPGVNRGYMKEVLDDSLRLMYFTAACGPLIYRAALFGDAYKGNAFVAEPAANLVKRNILSDSGYIVTGRQAWEGKEFLASMDERFRPVNLCLGPDGAMYVLDMYRGIIQHKTYLTPYLKNEIAARDLAVPLNCGRIYRIVPAGMKPQMVQLSKDPAALVAQLDHTNGWVRDKAQQMLVDGAYSQAVPLLKKRLEQKDNLAGRIHALWTLEGLNALSREDLLPLLMENDVNLQEQALAVLCNRPVEAHSSTDKRIQLQLEVLSANPRLAPMVAYALPSFSKPAANRLRTALYRTFPNDPFVAAALISGLKGEERSFREALIKWNPDTNLIIRRQLDKVIADTENRLKAGIDAEVVKAYPRGNLIFKTICQTCHGENGEGIASLAPPLNRSEVVTGDKERLIAIVLYGLTGPVTVNGKVYKLAADMPGIIGNDEFSDADIAELMSFIRNAWGNKASRVSDKDVISVKEKHEGRDKSFTMEEFK